MSILLMLKQPGAILEIAVCQVNKIKQGSDLIDLRLTWREMENLIYGGFFRIFGDILEDFWRFFEEFWRN